MPAALLTFALAMLAGVSPAAPVDAAQQTLDPAEQFDRQQQAQRKRCLTLPDADRAVCLQQIVDEKKAFDRRMLERQRAEAAARQGRRDSAMPGVLGEPPPESAPEEQAGAVENDVLAPPGERKAEGGKAEEKPGSDKPAGAAPQERPAAERKTPAKAARPKKAAKPAEPAPSPKKKRKKPADDGSKLSPLQGGPVED